MFEDPNKIKTYTNKEELGDIVVTSLKEKVGISDVNGNIIIPAFYDKIECVNIKYGITKIDEQDHNCKHKYCFYSRTYRFDTDKIDAELDYNMDYDIRKQYFDRLYRSSFSHDPYVFIIEHPEYFDISKPLILTKGNSSVLFKNESGICIKSLYEHISQIQEYLFVVRKAGKYGIFNLLEEEEIIPCEYDRIIYEGQLVLLLCKDGLWGATSLINKPTPSKFDRMLGVYIPLKYLEIEILNSAETLFGIKKYINKNEKERGFEYTIVDNNDCIYKKIKDYTFAHQFCYINDDKIITSLKSKPNKMGFVSADGYISIPFKYDEISQREDNRFDVRIGEAWGVIDVDGREIVPIKYKEKLRSGTSNIVRDAITKCYGVLDVDKGKEFIPCVFKDLIYHLGYYFFSYEEVLYGENYQYFGNSINTWGCINPTTGKIIIKPNYIRFIKEENFLIGERGILDKWGNFVQGIPCVYDLFSLEGELIIGGMTEYYYNSKVYSLFFGGELKTFCTYCDPFDSDKEYEIRLVKGSDLWLILDKNLRTVLRDKEGKQYQFKKGFIGEIRNEESDGKIRRIYNMPIEYMVKGFEAYNGNDIIIADKNVEDNENTWEFRKLAALNCITGEQTSFYNDIYPLGNGMFFYLDEKYKIGLITYKETIFEAKYIFVTCPVNGYYFAAEKIDNKNSCLYLLSVNDINFKEIAISKKETNSLTYDLEYGRLLLSSIDDSNDLTKLRVPYLSTFDNSFKILISAEETKETCERRHHIYWFDSDWREGSEYRFDSYLYEDDGSDTPDYMSDTWDALTDGMYGDMPDGYNGSSDF